MTVPDYEQVRAANEVNEDRILSARTGRNAAQTLKTIADDTTGVIYKFPTVIHQPHPSKDNDTYSYTVRVSQEPGALYKPGITEVKFTVTAKDITAEGSFYIGVDQKPTRRKVTFTQAKALLPIDDIPEWADTQLPSSVELVSQSAEELRSDAQRLMREGKDAEEQLLVEWSANLRKFAREANQKHLRGSLAASRLDYEDLYQEAVIEFLRNGLRRYIAPDYLGPTKRRPNAPVTEWIRVAIPKALRAKISKQLGVPAEVYTIRGWLRQARIDGIEFTTAEEAFEVVKYINTYNRLVANKMTPVEASREANRLRDAGAHESRFSIGQVRQAMEEPKREDHLSKPTLGSETLTLADTLTNPSSMDVDTDSIEMESILEGLYKSRGLSPEEVAAFEAHSGVRRDGVTRGWATTSELITSVRETAKGVRAGRSFNTAEIAEFEAQTGVRFPDVCKWADSDPALRKAKTRPANQQQARRLYESAVSKLQDTDLSELTQPALGDTRVSKDDPDYSRARARIMHPAMRHDNAA